MTKGKPIEMYLDEYHIDCLTNKMIDIDVHGLVLWSENGLSISSERENMNKNICSSCGKWPF